MPHPEPLDDFGARHARLVEQARELLAGLDALRAPNAGSGADEARDEAAGRSGGTEKE